MHLPPLDCHAHVAVSVTERQLERLRPAVVFAVTREPSEASETTARSDPDIVWGCGAHPAYVAKSGDVNIEQFARIAQRFALVGEIGLDRRHGNLNRQVEVFDALLEAFRDEPVLLSVHSTGCSGEVVESLRKHPLPGTIMHWFTGSIAEAEELLALGMYFSVNSAMRSELLRMLPRERLLPETDYPAARKRTGQRPGDTSGIEQILADIHGVGASDIRRRCYQNLRRVATESGALDRLPVQLAEMLLVA